MLAVLLSIPVSVGLLIWILRMKQFDPFPRFTFVKLLIAGVISVFLSSIVSTNGEGHGALAGVLKQLQADVLICGGIGMGARMALEEAGIDLFPGVYGRCDDVIKAYLDETLSYDPDASCHHHDHEEGHDCHHEGGCCH